VDSRGRTIFVADAHRDDGKRYVVRADEKLTAFLELEAAIRLLSFMIVSLRPSVIRQWLISRGGHFVDKGSLAPPLEAVEDKTEDSLPRFER
jgi:hypothetical protein